MHIYLHRTIPLATSEVDAPAEVEGASGDADKHAGLIMADAAMGNSPKWIARKHHMSEKYVRQVARDTTTSPFTLNGRMP